MTASCPPLACSGSSFALQNQNNAQLDQSIDQILEELTLQELELAAKASYEYLVRPNVEQTRMYAKRFAHRYLQDGDEDSAEEALQRMRETLRFRAEMNVERICNAFTSNGDVEYAKRLEQEMQCKNVYVQGYDKEGRSTYVFIPRNVKGHDKEWTLKQHIYTLERAVAASRAQDKTVNALVDFNGFSLGNAPPTQIGKDFMTTFRDHYAGSINSIYLVDAPASFYCLWSIFKPLIGRKARNKIKFVKSSNNQLGRYYEPTQVARWMMVNGKKNRELDMHEYLYKTPFHCAFDDERN